MKKGYCEIHLRIGKECHECKLEALELEIAALKEKAGFWSGFFVATAGALLCALALFGLRVF